MTRQTKSDLSLPEAQELTGIWQGTLGRLAKRGRIRSVEQYDDHGRLRRYIPRDEAKRIQKILTKHKWSGGPTHSSRLLPRELTQPARRPPKLPEGWTRGQSPLYQAIVAKEQTLREAAQNLKIRGRPSGISFVNLVVLFQGKKKISDALAMAAEKAYGTSYEELKRFHLELHEAWLAVQEKAAVARSEALVAAESPSVA